MAMTEAEALAAAESMFDESPATSEPAPQPATPAPSPATQSTEGPPADTPQDLGWLNRIPEDLRDTVKSGYLRQQDYTRKTQEIAEQRKQYEALSQAGVDPNDALQVYSFYNRLQTEPQFALEVAQHIQNTLGQSGQQEPVQAPAQDEQFDESEYAQLPPAMQQQLSNMQAQMKALQDEQLRTAYTRAINEQEAKVYEQHPDWDDTYKDQLFRTAHSTNGDLFTAANKVAAFEQHIIERYIGGKASVPTGVQSVGGSVHSTESEEPIDWSKMTLDDAVAAGKVRIAAEQGA